MEDTNKFVTSASQTTRPKRSPKPSQKNRENASQREQHSGDEATASEIEVVEPPSTAPNPRISRTKATKTQETEPTWATTMLQMIHNLQKTQDLISDELRKTRDELQTTHNELQTTRNELQTTRNELSNELQKAQAELREAQEQLQIIKFNQEQQSPRLSYVEVAKTPPTSSPSNLRSPSTGSLAPSAFTDTPFCTIDTSRTPEESPEKGNPSVLRSLVEREMRKEDGREAWRCVAVSKDSKNKDRIRVICRDAEELDKIKNIVQRNTAPETRVLRDQLYPVKVDNVNRTAVLDDQGNILSGAEEALGKENETHIAKIIWLSNKENGKAYGSMVVYVTKASEATALLNRQFFDAAGESAYTRPYERRVRPNQCYNCQELGHKAYNCRNTQTCARCAKPGHSHKECQSTTPKCIPCGGPHESFSKNCRILYLNTHGQ